MENNDIKWLSFKEMTVMQSTMRMFEEKLFKRLQAGYRPWEKMPEELEKELDDYLEDKYKLKQYER